MSWRRDLSTGLLVGSLLDALLPDARRGHPVAAFGTVAGALERRMYADSRRRGAAFAGACVGAVVLGGRVVQTWAPAGAARTAAVAAATWTVLGARSLRREAAAVHGLLDRGDLDGARQRLAHLVARDPSGLDADEVARAALESVAENTCDAVVAPLMWGAVAGLPGLLGYRAANTLDAMVGYRSARYARFGWAAARLDDVANFGPARVTGALIVLSAPAAGGSSAGALRIARRDGRRHPSPNAGISEAAVAGALGLRLGGRNVYGDRVEHRPILGDGRAVSPADLPRATRLNAAVTLAAALLAAAVAAGRRR